MAESGSWKKITIHTDGGCDGNPGPGGSAALLRYGNHVRELTGGEPATTNNHMELQAAISAVSLPPCATPLLPAVTQAEIRGICSEA
jgi:ribonuclease HI